MTPEERQSVLDTEHLRLLTLFHYISGGMTLVFASMFGVWLAFVSMMFAMFPTPTTTARCVAEVEKCAPGAEAAVPEFLPGVFIAMFGFLIALTVTLGVLEILAGWFISKRRRRLFSIIVAIPGLLFIPYGTLLAIFTMLILERPSVKALFDK